MFPHGHNPSSASSLWILSSLKLMSPCKPRYALGNVMHSHQWVISFNFLKLKKVWKKPGVWQSTVNTSLPTPTCPCFAPPQGSSGLPFLMLSAHPLLLSSDSPVTISWGGFWLQCGFPLLGLRPCARCRVEEVLKYQVIWDLELRKNRGWLWHSFSKHFCPCRNSIVSSLWWMKRGNSKMGVRTCWKVPNAQGGHYLDTPCLVLSRGGRNIRASRASAHLGASALYLVPPGGGWWCVTTPSRASLPPSHWHMTYDSIAPQGSS